MSYISDYYGTKQFDQYRNYFEPAYSRSRGSNYISYRHIDTQKVYRDIKISMGGAQIPKSFIQETKSFTYINKSNEKFTVVNSFAIRGEFNKPSDQSDLMRMIRFLGNWKKTVTKKKDCSDSSKLRNFKRYFHGQEYINRPS